ncbi:MAG: carbohydrate-binding domain-containing protein, partial [Eubacteriales bacterium]|nr:carbohydrate-binding domain-containing protein [Eubacteriales bacterium]
MKTKLRKFTAWFLCLTVLLMTVPMSSFADVVIPGTGTGAGTGGVATNSTTPVNYDLWVNDVRITSNNLTVACGAGTAVYDPDINVLTLTDAEITTGCSLEYLGSGILSRVDDLEIVVLGDCTITNTGGEGISTYHQDASYNLIPHDLKVCGSGTLTINEDTAYYGYGIYCTGNLIIADATIDITSAMTGLWANGNIDIADSTVTVDAFEVMTMGMTGPVKMSGFGIVTNTGAINIENSTLDITSALHGAILLGNPGPAGSLTIDSGNLTLNGEYGIEDGNPAFTSNVVINGGHVDITANTAATNMPESSFRFNNFYGVSAGELDEKTCTIDLLPSTSRIDLPVSTIESASDTDYVVRPALTAYFEPDSAIVDATTGTNESIKIDYYNPMVNPTGLDTGYNNIYEYNIEFPVKYVYATTLSGTLTVPIPNKCFPISAKIVGGAMETSYTSTTVTFPVTLDVASGKASKSIMIEYRGLYDLTLDL